MQKYIASLVWRKFLAFLLFSFLISNICTLFATNPGTWIWLPGCLVYVVGYYLGYFLIRSHVHIKKKLLFCANVGIIFICIAIRLGAKYFLDAPQNTLSSQFYNHVIVVDTHCCLSICFFVIASIALQHFNRLRKRLFELTRILSDYSFETYIVHYMFLTGVLSCSAITSNIFLNTFLAIAFIIISTLVLKTMAICFKRFFTIV